jgi:PII-like signaling protein
MDSMRVERDRVQLRVYVAEPHLHDRRSKVDQLMRRAAAAGASGGTVLQACRGFGRRHSHEMTIWHAPDETPLELVFVDDEERIERVLVLVDELLPDAFAITERVRAVRYIRPHSH